MTAADLIRQCGNPEYTIRMEDLPNGRIYFDGTSNMGLWAYRLMVGQLVRIRNQDGAELDRVHSTYEEMTQAHRKGAVDARHALLYTLNMFRTVMF